MNTSQASTSNDNCLRLYLDKKDISFLLSIVEKSEDIVPVGQEKLKEIYFEIDYACRHNIGFDPVRVSKEIKKVEDVIGKYKDIGEEVSEGIVFGYITEKDQPRAFEKLIKYREYLEQFERLNKFYINPD